MYVAESLSSHNQKPYRAPIKIYFFVFLYQNLYLHHVKENAMFAYISFNLHFQPIHNIMSSTINQSSRLRAEWAAQSSEFSVSVFVLFCERASLTDLGETGSHFMEIVNLFLFSSCWVPLWTDGFTCCNCHTIWQWPVPFFWLANGK